MKQLLVIFIYLFIVGCNNTNTDIDKILQAKAVVRTMVNYPDTLDFHDFSTSVNGNIVSLKFTCKNAFGVPETHISSIRVD
jgi:hypothetical protein